MTGADTVTCALCGHDWPENSDEVLLYLGNWFCTDIDACTERRLA